MLSKNDAVLSRFLAFSAFLLALATPTATQAPARYDVLIRNGRVLDDSSNPWLAADIGIRGGRMWRDGPAGQYDRRARHRRP